MATRKVKTPRQRQQERKEQMQREQTVEKIISAMTETVTRLQTVSAWAQWQNNAEAMTKGSHEATRSSSEQEMKNMMMGINKMMLQQQQQMQKQMEMQMMMQQTMQQQTQQFMEEQTKMQQDMMKILVKGKSISEEKVSKDTGEGGRRHGLTRSGQQMPDSEHKGRSTAQRYRSDITSSPLCVLSQELQGDGRR